MLLIYVPKASTLWTLAWLQCIAAATAMTPQWPHKLAPLHDGNLQNQMMPISAGSTDLTTAIILAYHLFSSSLLPVNRASLWCNASQLQRAQRTMVRRIDVFSMDQFWGCLFNGCSKGLHAYRKVLEKWRQILLLLSYNFSWWNHWYAKDETLGAFSKSGFTLMHSRQTQSRIYRFWPFSELYTVCGRYLQSLKERGMTDWERGRDKYPREKRGCSGRKKVMSVCACAGTSCWRRGRPPPYQSIF